MPPTTPRALAAVLATLVATWGVSGAAVQAHQEQQATHLVAELDYGSFQGAYSKQYNVSYWKKIPYAAPPVGENRFRGPQRPAAVEGGVYDSSQPFDMCPQRTVNGSEDCLYLGLYSRPWTRNEPLKPVVVTFYGGGFIQGSAYFNIPPSAYPILNVSSCSDMMFVYPNYRTNAFGFLPGKEVAADSNSDLNPGLLDQEAVLKWTKKYIQQFGGNPEDVTVWGQSAGGGSVLAQALGRGGKQKLFRKAMANSPFWPKTYTYDSPEAQALYDELAARTGCVGPNSLACLKRTDVQAIRDASLAISGSHVTNTSSFTWSPVIDGDFLQEPLSSAAAGGKVNMELAFAMHNTHEGENFVPAGLQNATSTGSPPFNSSGASFDEWLRGFLPGFGDCEIEGVKRLYPTAGTTETISYNTTYVRAGLIYRDVVLSCPALWFSGAAQKGGWLGEYSLDPSRHASDTIWWNQINAVQKSDPARYQGYTGAFASFFQTGDPNTLKLSTSAAASVPTLKNNKEWVVGAAGFVTAELDQLERRCRFWKKTAAKIPV
ncbi:carboxylesterase [Colletotrichum sublineola]|uniref:Carboxylic ester hydrolase n=1 Tax=Colletotrichum sublineola TaxID=1173701 RepID=A0A066XPJ1_COLSU|nr:carboxylesterase [Colletotrichum sublineola]KDN71133.1 putative carboxylesterase [Colletotrichum sublineola]